MHDLVVRNGFLVDGTGRPGFPADVAVDGDRIAAVGQVGRGRREIDAAGALVTPGWVDIHTHYDGQATWDPLVGPSGWHGVTTVVMGSCGVGFAPVRPSSRDWLIQVMEGVEDIPGAALSEGIRWDWETFPEYLDALEATPRVLDVGAQVPHAAVRAWVMGEDASEEREATAEEIGDMRRIVAEALRAGALGFSTSRTSLHKTAAGRFVAGTFAGHDELFGIGEALAETGRGVFQCASEHVTLGEDLAWMEALATRMGRPLSFNISQTDFAPELWREVLGKLEAAVERGAPLFAQVAGRAIGILMSWRTTAHPFVLHPRWQELASLPWDEQKAALKRPEVRAAILADTPVDRGVFEAYVTRSFHKMFRFAEGYEPAAATSLAARATAEGVRPEALAYDALMEDDAEAFLYFPLFNYADGNLDLLHELHLHPRTVMGLSDGGAHCGAICDGGMPTFQLTWWGRDRPAGLPLEHVIRRQTSATAAFFGMGDRGVVAPGYRADLNVIDHDRLALRTPELVHDLPAGGRRLVQRADGYRFTVCAGQITWADGEATGARPGRVIRSY